MTAWSFWFSAWDTARKSIAEGTDRRNPRLDPLLKPYLADALDIFGARAIGEAVEGVVDGLVLGKFGDGEFALELLVQGASIFAFVALARTSGGHHRATQKGEKNREYAGNKCRFHGN